MKFLLAPLLFFSLCASVQAGALVIGEPIPPLKIESLGEIQLSDDDIVYTPWSLQHPDIVHVLQYMAGTMSASKLNEPFTDALQQGIDYSLFYVTTIIDLDDSTWGTRGFVRREVEKNKRRYPLSSLILDDRGSGRKTWQLERKTSTIVIADVNGSIIYIKHGAMTEQEIEQALNLIRALVNS